MPNWERREAPPKPSTDVQCVCIDCGCKVLGRRGQVKERCPDCEHKHDLERKAEYRKRKAERG